MTCFACVCVCVCEREREKHLSLIFMVLLAVLDALLALLGYWSHLIWGECAVCSRWVGASKISRRTHCQAPSSSTNSDCTQIASFWEVWWCSFWSFPGSSGVGSCWSWWRTGSSGCCCIRRGRCCMMVYFSFVKHRILKDRVFSTPPFH